MLAYCRPGHAQCMHTEKWESRQEGRMKTARINSVDSTFRIKQCIIHLPSFVVSWSRGRLPSLLSTSRIAGYYSLPTRSWRMGFVMWYCVVILLYTKYCPTILELYLCLVPGLPNMVWYGIDGDGDDDDDDEDENDGYQVN